MLPSEVVPPLKLTDERKAGSKVMDPQLSAEQSQVSVCQTLSFAFSFA